MIAIATCLVRDRDLPGAVVLAKKIHQLTSEHNLVCLVVGTLNKNTIEVLNFFYDQLITISSDGYSDNELSDLAKINIWNLLQYDKVLFLNSSCFPIGQIGGLFELESFPFSHNGISACSDSYWPDAFNTDVFVTRPSKNVFDELSLLFKSNGTPTEEHPSSLGSGPNADPYTGTTKERNGQSILNTYFSSSWHNLSYNYNVPIDQSSSSQTPYQYLPALHHYQKDVKIVRFTGEPWKEESLSRTPDKNEDPSILDYYKQWWTTFLSNPYGHKHELIAHLYQTRQLLQNWFLSTGTNIDGVNRKQFRSTAPNYQRINEPYYKETLYTKDEVEIIQDPIKDQHSTPEPASGKSDYKEEYYEPKDLPVIPPYYEAERYASLPTIKPSPYAWNPLKYEPPVIAPPHVHHQQPHEVHQPPETQSYAPQHSHPTAEDSNWGKPYTNAWDQPFQEQIKPYVAPVFNLPSVISDDEWKNYSDGRNQRPGREVDYNYPGQVEIKNNVERVWAAQGQWNGNGNGGHYYEESLKEKHISVPVPVPVKLDSNPEETLQVEQVNHTVKPAYIPEPPPKPLFPWEFRPRTEISRIFPGDDLDGRNQKLQEISEKEREKREIEEGRDPDIPLELDYAYMEKLVYELENDPIAYSTSQIIGTSPTKFRTPSSGSPHSQTSQSSSQKRSSFSFRSSRNPPHTRNPTLVDSKSRKSENTWDQIPSVLSYVNNVLSQANHKTPGYEDSSSDSESEQFYDQILQGGRQGYRTPKFSKLKSSSEKIILPITPNPLKSPNRLPHSSSSLVATSGLDFQSNNNPTFVTESESQFKRSQKDDVKIKGEKDSSIIPQSINEKFKLPVDVSESVNDVTKSSEDPSIKAAVPLELLSDNKEEGTSLPVSNIIDTVIHDDKQLAEGLNIVGSDTANISDITYSDHQAPQSKSTPLDSLSESPIIITKESLVKQEKSKEEDINPLTTDINVTDKTVISDTSGVVESGVSPNLNGAPIPGSGDSDKYQSSQHLESTPAQNTQQYSDIPGTGQNAPPVQRVFRDYLPSSVDAS